MDFDGDMRPYIAHLRTAHAFNIIEDGLDSVPEMAEAVALHARVIAASDFFLREIRESYRGADGKVSADKHRIYMVAEREQFAGDGPRWAAYYALCEARKRVAALYGYAIDSHYRCNFCGITPAEALAAATGRTLADAASEHAARPVSGTNVDRRA